jgi:hypothetical protein
VSTFKWVVVIILFILYGYESSGPVLKFVVFERKVLRRIFWAYERWSKRIARGVRRVTHSEAS